MIIFSYLTLNLRSLSMLMLHDIFIFGFFDVKTKEECVRDNYNVLEIILKNGITWKLNNCFKGPDQTRA